VICYDEVIRIADAMWASEAQKRQLKHKNAVATPVACKQLKTHYAPVACGQLKAHYAPVAGGQLKAHYAPVAGGQLKAH